MKRRTVTFTPQARSDLLSIGDWIAERAGSEIALNYVARLEAYCEGFEFSGERGQRRDDLSLGLRVVGFERRGRANRTPLPRSRASTPSSTPSRGSRRSWCARWR
ncbi:MAG: type II toxin-antitoxin system RelE/ParE family toxin [Rhodospirillales bacterium]|nr:type II toxin-antitoxin system RelE/ParE family toxin [Rhodospirillales bacterium]